VADLTLKLQAMDGTRITARLVRPEHDERSATIWGERKVEYSERGVDFYQPVRSNRQLYRDPCGLRIGHVSERLIPLRRQKNGNLKISYYSARNGEPRIYVRKLASAEVERLLGWLEVAEAEEALLERAAAFAPQPHSALRPSALAA